MARIVGNCWKCGSQWESDSQPGRGDACPRCDLDFHSCRNCRHHDPRYHNECRVPDTEFIRDREKANFCDQFEIAAKAPGGAGGKDLEEARKRFNRLFGGE